jgi:hypothetical protein
MVYDVARRKAFRADGHQHGHAMRQVKKGSNPLHKVPHGCWAAVKGLVRTGFNAVWTRFPPSTTKHTHTHTAIGGDRPSQASEAWPMSQ